MKLFLINILLLVPNNKFPEEGTNVASETLWGMLCMISFEAHVKSIQGVIGMSERVMS